MAPANLGFFASIDEQRKWLADVGRRYDGWCVIDNRSERLLTGRLAELETLFASSNQGQCRIFVGRTELSPEPVGLDPTHAWPIDMVRSLAVEIVPAYVVGSVMIEGRIDINKASDYADRQQYQKLRQWMSELARSIETEWNSDKVQICLIGADGSRSSPGGRHVVSPEARNWARHGGSLKQFPNGAFSFEPVLLARP